MYIDDEQSVVAIWNGKPIGKLFCGFAHPIDGITATVWKGTCLGEPVIDGGLVNAEMKALKVALRHGITDVTYENGAGVDTLYMPAFEE